MSTFKSAVIPVLALAVGLLGCGSSAAQPARGASEGAASAAVITASSGGEVPAWQISAYAERAGQPCLIFKLSGPVRSSVSCAIGAPKLSARTGFWFGPAEFELSRKSEARAHLAVYLTGPMVSSLRFKIVSAGVASWSSIPVHGVTPEIAKGMGMSGPFGVGVLPMDAATTGDWPCVKRVIAVDQGGSVVERTPQQVCEEG